MLNILIVDDSGLMRKILANNIDKITQAKIQNAFDGRKAMALLKDRPNIDMLFLDMKMPIISGFEIADYLKKSGQMEKMVVVAISSELDEKNTTILQQYGIMHFVPKPFDLASFNSVVVPLIKGIEANKS